MNPLTIGNLVARIPIIQGGMGVGISLSSLAGTVSREGGIGIISAAQIGFKEKDFLDNPLEANMKAIRKHIQKAREIAQGGVLGVNIMVATKNYAKYVKEAVANGIDLIISGAGLPMELPELTKGTDTKIVPIVSSKKAANIIFKMWEKKSNRIPDAIVIEGPKAGGHLGFSLEQIILKEFDFEREILEIISLVKNYEEKYKRNIPVIVAGGIETSEDVKKYMSMGANGVQVATKFVTTEECDADIKYKQAYIDCKEEDITIVKSPVGMPGRAINNEFIKKVSKGKIPITHCYSCITPCKPLEAPYCITKALINAALGNVDEGLLFCGANAYKETKVRTVRKVIDELMGK